MFFYLRIMKIVLFAFLLNFIILLVVLTINIYNINNENIRNNKRIPSIMSGNNEYKYNFLFHNNVVLVKMSQQVYRKKKI